MSKVEVQTYYVVRTKLEKLYLRFSFDLNIRAHVTWTPNVEKATFYAFADDAWYARDRYIPEGEAEIKKVTITIE